MPSLDERVKNIIVHTQKEHAQRIDDRISSVFLFGFVTGVFFAYSGIMGFITGIIAGAVITRKFPDVAYSRVNRVVDIVSYIFRNKIEIYNEIQ